MPLSTYTWERWVKIFQVLEAEAQQTPMLSPEGIMREKVEGVKIEKRVVPLIKAAPEEFLVDK